MEYESFRSRALKEPEDSREMIDLIAFMETARNELVRDLWERVQDSLKRLSYLLDVHSFSANEMETNRTTLMWPSKLNPVFERNEQVLCKVYLKEIYFKTPYLLCSLDCGVVKDQR